MIIIKLWKFSEIVNIAIEQNVGENIRSKMCYTE